MIVDPTKLNPRRLRSRLNASDSGVDAGIFAKGLPAILPWSTVDELPAILVEASEFSLHQQKRLSVLDGGRDFHPVPDDSRIDSQFVDSRLRIPRDLLRIELAKCAAIALAFIEHDRPAESRLRTFENEKLEMCAVTMGRNTPFPIVILAQQIMIDVDPGTPFWLPRWHASRPHEGLPG